MFINDYYFGYGNLILLLRIIGGPLIVFIGYNLYRDGFDKFSVAYSGLCIIYGIYMIFKPYLWILFRLDYYKTEEVNIKITENEILITDNNNESKIDFKTFKKILNKKNYYAFIISRSFRIRIPKRIVSLEGQDIINKRIR